MRQDVKNNIIACLRRHYGGASFSQISGWDGRATAVIADALIQLIQDGKVIRKSEDCYALPDPPLPELSYGAKWWLRTIEANGGSIVIFSGGQGYSERVEAKNVGCLFWSWESRTDHLERYTITDLGRKVLAAQECR